MTENVWNPYLKRNEIELGGNLSLKCVVPLLDDVDIDWHFKRNKLAHSDKVLISGIINTDNFRTQKILINNMTKSDQGSYSCIDTLREEEAIKIEIIEKIAPRIKSNFQNYTKSKMTKSEGESLFLDCKVEEMSIRELGWYKDGFPVSFKSVSRRIIAKNFYTSLEIDKLNLNDAGNYSCVAVNSFGRDRKFVEISFQGKAEFSRT